MNAYLYDRLESSPHDRILVLSPSVEPAVLTYALNRLYDGFNVAVVAPNPDRLFNEVLVPITDNEPVTVRPEESVWFEGKSLQLFGPRPNHDQPRTPTADQLVVIHAEMLPVDRVEGLVDALGEGPVIMHVSSAQPAFSECTLVERLSDDGSFRILTHGQPHDPYRR